MPASTDVQFWKKMGEIGRDRIYAALGPTPTGISEVDHEVEMRDGTSITIRSYTPDKAPECGSPLIVLFHGGGFTIGGLENEHATCRDFAVQLGAVVLNVGYRLAPENPFPAPVNDAWDSVKWVSDCRFQWLGKADTPERQQRMHQR
jgi:acetyl esterase/lipase